MSTSCASPWCWETFPPLRASFWKTRRDGISLVCMYCMLHVLVCPSQRHWDHSASLICFTHLCSPWPSAFLFLTLSLILFSIKRITGSNGKIILSALQSSAKKRNMVMRTSCSLRKFSKPKWKPTSRLKPFLLLSWSLFSSSHALWSTTQPSSHATRTVGSGSTESSSALSSLLSTWCASVCKLSWSWKFTSSFPASLATTKRKQNWRMNLKLYLIKKLTLLRPIARHLMILKMTPSRKLTDGKT